MTHETNEEVVEALIECAKKLGKLRGRSDLYRPVREKELENAKKRVLERMTPDPEIVLVPGAKWEPFQTTPPPFNPETELQGGLKRTRGW